MSQKKTTSHKKTSRNRLFVRRRRRITRSITCFLVLLIVIAGAIHILGNWISESNNNLHTPTSSIKDTIESQKQGQYGEVIEVEEVKEPAYEPASVSLIAVGDNLIHNTLLKDAANGDGTYDFTSFYQNIKPYVSAADIAFVNQESPLGTGEPSAYPSFNTPQACGKALVEAGFDVIGQANNHTMDVGSSAVYDTLDFWDSFAENGVIRVGIARDAQDRATVRYIERNGLKIGFLAYTYGLNGLSVPQDNPDLVSLIDKDKIATEMAEVRKNCDAVVVAMHWGQEYQNIENEEQAELAKFLADHGASVIIGSHPHVCQPAKWIESDNGNRAFCIYSTGNFISSQNKSATMVEGMLQVTLTRQVDGSIVVENPGVMPMVCWFDSNWRNYTVIPLDDYTEERASTHALASRVDMSTSYIRAIAQNAFGEFMIEKTVPTTFDAAYAASHNTTDTIKAD